MKRLSCHHLDHQRRERVVVEEQRVPLREGELACSHQQLLRHLEARLVQQLRSTSPRTTTVSCAKEGSRVFIASADTSFDLLVDMSFDLLVDTMVDMTI